MKSSVIIVSCLLAVALVALVAIGVVGTDATQHPFQGAQNVSADVAEAFQRGVAHFQQQLKGQMTKLACQLQQGDRSVAAWLLGLAFFYGMVHAVGPGHGKVVVASYLLSGRRAVRRAVGISALAALLHGVSAIVVVMAIKTLMTDPVGRTFQLWSGHLQVVAYAMISGLGAVLLIRRLVRWRSQRRGRVVGETDKSVGQQRTRYADGWMLLALGAVPCPATMIILLFFLAMEMTAFGVAMALMVAVGMAVTLVLVGVSTVLAQGTMTRRREGQSERCFYLLREWVAISGAFLLLVFGLLMLWVN